MGETGGKACQHAQIAGRQLELASFRDDLIHWEKRCVQTVVCLSGMLDG